MLNKLTYLFLVLLFNGCYLKVPKAYLNDYKVAYEAKQKMSVNTGEAIICQKKVASVSIQSLDLTNFSVIHYFYTNNLICRIALPVRVNNEWITTFDELELRMIKDVGEINDICDWAFFTVINDSTIQTETVEYSEVSRTALNFPKIRKKKLKVKNQKIIITADADEVLIYRHAKIKPDSLHSDLYCRAIHQPKFYKRIYSKNHPKYSDPCKRE